MPVYALRGTVSTPQLERYDFTRYVAAVKVSPRQTKRMGVATQVLAGVF